MKRGVVFGIVFLFFIMNISFILSATTNATSTPQDKGYLCLQGKVSGQCSSLSTEEKIFSMLALGQCKAELLSDSLNSECWPSSGCKVKTTAQAIMALKNSQSVNDSVNWMLGQKMIPSGINWLLQIDTNNASKCTLSYSGNSYTIKIDPEKEITSNNLGSCFRLAAGNYWLQIQSSCYDQQFQISCDDSFTTNLLYQDSASSTVYVLNEINSAAAEGTTKEQVSSSCFKQGSSCDYEGTLWGVLALQSLGYDIKPYLPYLITKQSSNEQYLPEARKNSFIGDPYGDQIASKQQQNEWWLVSGDKFYDTAVALFPFQQQTSSVKDNAITWLTQVQGSDGCWQDNIRNTAFLLYSVWPRAVSIPQGSITGQDCESSGFFCSTKPTCQSAEGQELKNYTGCFGSNICCSEKYTPPLCLEQNGSLCDSNEDCPGQTADASDAVSGKTCCLQPAACTPMSETPTCDSNGGTCKSSCSGTDVEISYTCSGSDICCLVQQQTSSGADYTWVIVVLLILIVLVVIGIIFRKKLKLFLMRFKKGGGKKPSNGKFPPRGFPPGYPPSSQIQPRFMPRRIIPSQPIQRPVQRPAYRTAPSASSQPPARQPAQPSNSPSSPSRSKEAEDVLKKLRELGK